MRYPAGVASTVDRNKKALALLSACLLALVPWMQISKAVSADVSVSLASLAAVVACGVAIHLAYLAFNMTAVRLLGIGGTDGDACEPCSSYSPACAGAPHTSFSIGPEKGNRCLRRGPTLWYGCH